MLTPLADARSAGRFATIPASKSRKHKNTAHIASLLGKGLVIYHQLHLADRLVNPCMRQCMSNVRPMITLLICMRTLICMRCNSISDGALSERHVRGDALCNNAISQCYAMQRTTRTVSGRHRMRTLRGQGRYPAGLAHWRAILRPSLPPPSLVQRASPSHSYKAALCIDYHTNIKWTSDSRTSPQ